MSNSIQRTGTSFLPRFLQARRFFSVFVPLSLLCFGPITQAVELDNACTPQWITTPQTVPPVKDQEGATYLEADSLTQPQSDLYLLSGQARIRQPGTVVLADQIHYQKSLQKGRAFGQVELHRSDLIITAEEGGVDHRRKTARLLNTRYQVKPSRAHGHADSIDVDQPREVARLADATFTTCPIQNYAEWMRNGSETDPEVAWEMTFNNLEINQKTRRVYGKHTTLYFQDLPIFYTPYFDFPLDDRASGLLFPELGGYKSITDEESALYYAQPYYFNLAPNYDDTLTLMLMENRGPVLENEFRYLGKAGSVKHQTEFTVTLTNDQQTASDGLASLENGDVVYGDKLEQRWRGKLKSNQTWGHGFSSNLLWHEASDEQFFAEIPVESQLKTATYTPRYAQLNYRQENWQAYAQLYSYLRLRDAPVNYEKRPEIGVRYSNSFDSLNFNLASEATEFDVPLSDHNKPEALRTRVSPELDYGIQKPWGHLKATVAAHHMTYNLHNKAGQTELENSYQHTIPQYALRGGLIFERNFDLGGHSLIQTLEPELQYLYVPYVDQSDIQRFDTGSRSLHFSNLFAFNRFTGFDRIGDTSQVTAALTSKLLDENGTPLLEAGLGQIIYLQDRKVQLNNSEPDTAEASDYFMKLGANAKNLYFYSTGQFTQEKRELLNANSRLRWQWDDQSKLLLNHALTNYNLDSERSTVAAGATIQVTPRWEVGTYWNYDLTNEIRNEVVHSIRYDDCCWAGELSVEETQLENGLYNYTVQFLIELKGLSTTGQTFKNFLDNKLDF